MSKVQHLSQFQKQQYTQYLETQLEKFSAFMLSQKKENQTYHQLHQIIHHQNQQISSLNDRLKALELYQRENFKQCERIENSTVRAVDFDQRLKKVESVYFEQPHLEKQNLMRKSNMENKQTDKQIQFKKDILKKVKQIQKEVKDIVISQKQQSTKRSSYDNARTNTNYSQERNSYQSVHDSFVSKKELKNVENKLFQYFGDKFNKIQKVVRKSVANKKDYKKKELQNNPVVSRIDQMLVQEQTFGIQENFKGQPFQDYEEIGFNQMRPISHEKSYSISDASTRLKPVKYFSHKNTDKQEQKRRSFLGKIRSRSKSQKRQQSRSKDKSQDIERSGKRQRTGLKQRSKSKSISQSRSKSHQSRSKSKKVKKVNKIVNSVNTSEYKMNCRKKHF